MQWFTGALLFLGAARLLSAMSVVVTPSTPSPAPVGTVVTFSAVVPDASPGTLWYRFSAHRAGTALRIVRDYGPLSTLDWATTDPEGPYEIQVSVRNIATGDTASANVPYDLTSRVADAPAITTTANPLVFLYSAPPCAAPGRMRVQFSDPDGLVQSTPYKVCTGLSMNFYLAGMRPQTTMSVMHIIDTGCGVLENGPALTLTTGTASVTIAPRAVLVPNAVQSTTGVLLYATLILPPVATDLAGNLLWYYSQPLTFLTRAGEGGTFYGAIVDPHGDPSQQVLREFDVAGNTIRETNAARVNEQLAAMGKRQINDFHHEVLPLADGGILALGSTEQMMTNVPTADVIGEMVVVLDRDLQVTWSWDAFDHLDPHRTASLGELCRPIAAGCPPLYLAPVGNDWLHANAANLTADGNVLLSLRHQDWVIKIDYQYGAGTGDVLWRLGPGGDFQMDSNDPSPWFSHQHDAEFVPGRDSLMTVFDDGNLRQAVDPNAHSRAQALRIDEQNRVATLVFNADLGTFVFATGSVQALHNGNYHVDVAWLPDNTSQALEFDPATNRVRGLAMATPVYRSFRMPDLYTPPESFGAIGPPVPRPLPPSSTPCHGPLCRVPGLGCRR